MKFRSNAARFPYRRGCAPAGRPFPAWRVRRFKCLFVWRMDAPSPAGGRKIAGRVIQPTGKCITFAPGKMPEWSIGPHSKCGERATVPRVRIPVFPPDFRKALGDSRMRRTRLAIFRFSGRAGGESRCPCGHRPQSPLFLITPPSPRFLFAGFPKSGKRACRPFGCGGIGRRQPASVSTNAVCICPK